MGIYRRTVCIKKEGDILDKLKDFRKIDIIWDHASNSIKKNIEAVSSDYNGRMLRVGVLVNGNEVRLDDKELHLSWTSASGKNVGLDVFDGAKSRDGIFDLHFTSGMLSNVGTLVAHFVLKNKYDNEDILTSKPFNISVLMGVNSQTIKASDSFTSLIYIVENANAIIQGEQGRVNSEAVREAQESIRINNEDARMIKWGKVEKDYDDGRYDINYGDLSETDKNKIRDGTGIFMFDIVDGDLLLYYKDGDPEPPFSITDDGDLIYTFKE